MTLREMKRRGERERKKREKKGEISPIDRLYFSTVYKLLKKTQELAFATPSPRAR